MSETVHEQVAPPELIALHDLLVTAENAARYFGGRAFRAGLSDVAEAAYTVGSTFKEPPNKTCIMFMAERFRDEPGEAVATQKYWLHLAHEQTLYKEGLPQDVSTEIDDLLDEPDPASPPVLIQRVMNLRFVFDDDGGFESFHDTFYRVDDQLGDTFMLHVEDEGIINISDESGDVWEDISEYVEDDAEDENDESTLGSVALLDTPEQAGEPEDRLDTADLTDDIFRYMIEGLVLSSEDMRTARLLIQCVRKRDISDSLRRTLGITEAYNPSF